MTLDFQHIAEHLATGGTVGSLSYAAIRVKLATVTSELKTYREETAAWRAHVDEQFTNVFNQLMNRRG